MNKIPIIVLANDDVNQLWATLNSLEKTDLQDNPVIVIDDCSQDEQMQKFLFTSDAIKVSTGFLSKSKAGLSHLIEERDVISIKRKYTTIKAPKKLGKSFQVLFAIYNGLMLYPKAKQCVIISSGTVLNREWLSGVIGAVKDGIGITIPQKAGEDVIMVSSGLMKRMLDVGLFTNISIKQDESIIKRLETFSEKCGLSVLRTVENFAIGLNSEDYLKPIAWDYSF